MPLPDLDTRLALFRKATAAIDGVSVSDELLVNLAKRSVGWSHADVQKVISTANNRRPNGETWLDSYLSNEFESYGNGAVNALGEEDARITAYHEAGHAIVALKLGAPVQFVTIAGRGGYLGYAFSAEESKKLHSKKDICDFICRAMGGRAAEAHLLGADGVTAGASGDIAAALRATTDMVCRYGMEGLRYTLGNASGEMTAEARERVYELLERQMARACEIVDAEWSSLNAVAQALIERQSLSEDELAALLKG
jgi:ATP-dependent Zn protease